MPGISWLLVWINEGMLLGLFHFFFDEPCIILKPYSHVVLQGLFVGNFLLIDAAISAAVSTSNPFTHFLFWAAHNQRRFL